VVLVTYIRLGKSLRTYDQRQRTTLVGLLRSEADRLERLHGRTLINQDADRGVYLTPNEMRALAAELEGDANADLVS
jgi:hypothetical protein